VLFTLLIGIFYQPKFKTMKKILVVDDDPDILQVVDIILTGEGFNVHTHSTGNNVPEIVDNYHPDLVLLDIQLPGKQGNEICKDLKHTDSNLPVILFSAHVKREKAVDVCNADAFIQKPFDVSHLISTINMHVN
jgi:DNA-binding response OmpR family regulator